MGIAWGSLLMVCVVSLAAGVAVVALVAFALVGLSARATQPVPGSQASRREPAMLHSQAGSSASTR